MWAWPLLQQQQPLELVCMSWLFALRGATSPSAAAGAAGRCTKDRAGGQGGAGMSTSAKQQARHISTNQHKACKM